MNPSATPVTLRDSSRPRPLVDSVLRLIWQQEKISRADIARSTKLARSTVSEIVSSLLPTGLVAEVGPGESSGGRRPIVLEFVDDACVVLGVEMGAAHVGIALTDLRGRVLGWNQEEFAVREDPKGTRDLILKLGKRLLEQSGRNPLQLLGVGLAIPAPLDPEQPDHLSEVVLPNWNGQVGLDAIQEGFGVPVLVDNDANLGALAEQWWGAGKGIDNFAYIKVATGIGAGHVVRGEVYRGATGVAGEIGHISVDPKGSPCLCGLNGCLATLVGTAAIEAQAFRLLPEFPASILHGSSPTIASIEAAALERDPLASQLVRDAAEHLGVALAGMINILNPSLVVLGGGLSNLGERLLEPVRAAVHRRTLITSVDEAIIRTSELGTRAVAVGAATLVLKSALADPRMFPAPPSTLETV